MRDSKNSLVAGALAMIICIGLVSMPRITVIADAVSSDTATTVTERIAQIKADREYLQKKMDENEASLENAKAELQLIAEQMALLDQEYGYQQGLVDVYEEKLSSLRVQISEKTEQTELQYQEMSAMLRAIEEAPANNVWSIILSSRTFGDAIHDIQLYNDIVEYEKNVLDDYKQEQSTLFALKSSLQKEEAVYNAAAMDLERTSTNYRIRADALNRKIRDLEVEASDLQEAFSYYDSAAVIEGTAKYCDSELTAKEIEEYLSRAYEELESADISAYEKEMRLSLLENGLGLVGRVPYWFGGRSYRPGWNSEWWTMKPIIATTSQNYPCGVEFPYGLDCGGFVFWSYLTLYGKDSWESPVEWMAPLGAGGIFNANEYVEYIDWDEKLPGDLVVNEPISHIGLYLCSDENGDAIYLHCTGQKGVIVSNSSMCRFSQSGRLKSF